MLQTIDPQAIDNTPIETPAHEMRVQDKSGDSRVMWDKSKPDEVAAARTMFDQLVKKGYTGYSVKDDAEKGGKLDKFDPDLERIIMVPRMAGG